MTEKAWRQDQMLSMSMGVRLLARFSVDKEAEEGQAQSRVVYHSSIWSPCPKVSTTCFNSTNSLGPSVYI